MGANSKIEWCDATWSPLRARNPSNGKKGWHCVKCSPACAHCYAETFNARGLPNGGTGLPYFVGSPAESYLDETILRQPLKWRKPRRVFVCSMTDMFGEWVKDEWIDRVFAIMARCPWHTFMLLTKRAERMRRYLCALGRKGRINDASILHDNNHLWFKIADDKVAGPAWPLPNVWCGVSVENQKYADERIPHLIRADAAVRFLSCEPLLGPLDLQRWLPADAANWECQKCGSFQRDDTSCLHCNADAVYLSGSHVANKRAPGTFTGWVNRQPIDQVIVGGESGRNARPCHPDWVRSLKDQCKAAKTAFFLKQWGEWAPYHQCRIADGWSRTRTRGNKIYGKLHTHDFSDGYKEIPVLGGREFESIFVAPGSVGFCKVGKKAAGRLLDGVEYSEFPEVAHG